MVKFFKIVGERAQFIIDEYNLCNNNKANQPLADMVIRNAVKEFNITKRVVFSIFKIGGPRYKRLLASGVYWFY